MGGMEMSSIFEWKNFARIVRSFDGHSKIYKTNTQADNFFRSSYSVFFFFLSFFPFSFLFFFFFVPPTPLGFSKTLASKAQGRKGPKGRGSVRVGAVTADR